MVTRARSSWWWSPRLLCSRGDWPRDRLEELQTACATHRTQHRIDAGHAKHPFFPRLLLERFILLRWRRPLGSLRRLGNPQKQTTLLQIAGPIAIRKQAVVADPMEAPRKDVDQKTPDELRPLQPQRGCQSLDRGAVRSLGWCEMKIL